MAEIALFSMLLIEIILIKNLEFYWKWIVCYKVGFNTKKVVEV